MSEGLDVIVVDDEPEVCDLLKRIIKRFYVWGEVISFTNVDDALEFCLARDLRFAIFVLDVFLGDTSGFRFLDTIEEKFPTAPEDTIIITGHASDDVVDMCVASDVNYLLEKPIRPHALQLAVRAIVSKYMKFTKKILEDPSFAESVARV